MVNDEKASFAIGYRSDDKMPGLLGLISKRKQLCTCSTLFCTFLSFEGLQRENSSSRNFQVTRYIEEILYVLLYIMFFTAAHLYLGSL